MAILLPQRVTATQTHRDVWSCPGSGGEQRNFKRLCPPPGATIAPPAAEVKRRRGGQGSGMLRVEELERLLVDLHVLAIGDGRRLGRAHEMAPAPRKAGGVELLEGGLMVLE